MRAVFLVVVAVLATLLDLTLFSEIRLWNGHPSACTALIATWSVLRRREDVMLLTPLCGLALGLLGNEPLGASLIGLSAVAFLGWTRTPEGAEGRFVHAMGVTLAGAMINTAVLVLVVSAIDRLVPDVIFLTRAMVGAGILTMPLAAMIYLPLARTAWQPRTPGQFRRL